jgi:hypothetical protein
MTTTPLLESKNTYQPGADTTNQKHSGNDLSLKEHLKLSLAKTAECCGALMSAQVLNHQEFCKMLKCLKLKISLRGSVHATEITKTYRSEALRQLLVKHLGSHRPSYPPSPTSQQSELSKVVILPHRCCC